MSSTRPLGSGDNFFHTKLQLPLLNATYEGLPRSYVVEHIFAISTLVKKGDTFSKIWASVYAIAIPTFLGASIIQLFLVTTCDTVTSCLGYSRKEYIVIDQGEVDKKKKALETRDTSSYKGVRELALHVAAIATTLICYVPGIFAPGIYCRDDLERLPKTMERQSHEEKLTSQREEHRKQLTSEQQSHQEELSGIKEQLENVQAENHRLLEANKTAKLDALFEMFPTITSHNLQATQSILSSLELEEGITLSVVTKESLRRVYSQETWGTADGEAFDKAKASYTSVKLTDKDQFLEPIGTIELRINCGKVDSPHLKLILAKSHQIHRLVLINPDMEILETAQAEGVLSNIHSLVIQEHEDLKCDQLCQISKHFKNIACFDVRGCRLDQDLSEKEEFMTAHIVCGTRHKVKRSEESVAVQFEESEEFDNIKDQFEHLNKEILFEQMIKNFDRQNSDAMHFANFLPLAGENRLFHPAAPFVTKLCCFRGSEIGSIHLMSLMPRLAKSFPHLRVLDFGGCKLLDCEALSHMENYPVLNLYLDGCEGIFYRQITTGIDKHKSAPEYVFQNKRHYLLDVSYVANRFLYLFNQGTKLIRLRRMECTVTTGSNSPRSRGKDKTHFEIIKSHFERNLFREMDNMAQPPRSHQTYIGVYAGSKPNNFEHDCRKET